MIAKWVNNNVSRLTSSTCFLCLPWDEAEPAAPAQSKTGKYVPPSLRDGSTRRGESMQPNRRGVCPVLILWSDGWVGDYLSTLSLLCSTPSGCNKCLSLFLADDNATIRVTNLSEDTRETDLQELFRPFGSISRIYLAKDKNTGQSKVSGADWLFSSALGPIIHLLRLVALWVQKPSMNLVSSAFLVCRALPSSVSTAARMQPGPSQGCLDSVTTISSSMLNGPSE